MSTTKEKFSSLSPAEFFKRNAELVGFSNPTKALYQSVRELVENSLDATDIHLILPNIKLSINRIESEQEIYKITIEDNGIGIPQSVIPNAFARVLYSSKYVIRQSRGMYGLGVKAVVLYSQMYQERPIEVISSTIGSKRIYGFKLKIDINKNEPIIYGRYSIENSANWHGTIVTVYILGDWSKSKQRIYEYIKRTHVITPYADFTFLDPEGKITHLPRITNKMPKPPQEVKPHPYGVDIELIKQIIANMRKKGADVKWFLMNEFQGIGEKTAQELLNMSGINEKKKVERLTEEELSKLTEAMKNYAKFRSPSADALSSIGEELIEIGLRSSFNPEFAVAVTRNPEAYQGHPFIVEAGIAYGGNILPVEEPIVLRYANKIPLIYDEKADVVWKVVSELDWKRYGIDTFPAPLVVMTHICSTKIPYKSAGKESIADVEEIEKELKNGLMEAARRLKLYLSEKKKEESARRKALTYMKYIPEVSRSLAIFKAGKKEEARQYEQDITNKLKTLIAERLNMKDLQLLEEVKVEAV
ncbi:DNA topoisomerase VI subunit B [Sulfolobales archaeon HS-7]|nr:DNA topoisomerase VI subunit B [Sulfolobales archaeon HS-7]